MSNFLTGAANLLAALRRKAQDANIVVSLIPSYLANQLWLIQRKFLSLAREGYGNNAVVYSVLRVLSSAVAEPPIVIYTQKSDGSLTRMTRRDHPLAVLLERPNELMTQYEFWELTTLHIGIAGHSYWWKERDRVGQILALWPLRPDRVGPIYSTSDVEGEKALMGWAYLAPGTGTYIPIPRRDLLAFNLPDPAGESGGMIEGLGPLQALAAEVGADNEATKFVGNLITNYATPSLAIKTKVPLVSEEDAKRLKAGWMQQFGDMRRGEPAILDADSDITQLSFSLDKLEFPDLRAIAEARICSAFGVPSILVGIRAGLTVSIKATISEQREYFAETTLANYWRRFSDQVTEDIAKEYDLNLVCRFDTTQVKALHQQTRQQKQPIADAWEAGVALLDEYREHVLSLPPLGPPYGSLLKWQTTDIQYQTGLSEDETTGSLVPVGSKRAPVTIDLEALRAYAGRNGHQTAVRARPKVGGRHEAAARAASRATTMTTLLASQFEKRIAQTLAGARDAVVTNLPTSLKIDVDPSKAMGGNFEQYLAELQALLEALQVEGVQDGYEGVPESGGFDVENPHVSAAVAGLGMKIKDINETTRAAVRDAIQVGIDTGLSIPEIAALITGDGAFGAARATLIARTESRVAYNQGAAAAMRDLGANYVYIDDGDKDEPCAEVSGTIQTIEWFEENPISHPQCTRAAAPVPAGEEPKPDEGGGE